MLGGPLEGNVHDLGAGTQLLPAEYVAAAVEPGDAECLDGGRGAVHGEGHLLFGDDRVERVETDGTGGVCGVGSGNGSTTGLRFE